MKEASGPVSDLPPPAARLGRGVRKDLVRQVAEYLESGESVRYAFYAAYGPWRSWTRRLQPHYGIVVTDQAVLVFRPRGGVRVTPAEDVRRLPRASRFNPAKTWLPYKKAELAGEPIWIHWEFAKDARQADSELSE